MKTKTKQIAVRRIVFFLIVFTFAACNRKLDEDGGYYDPKTKTYIYVHPASAKKRSSIYPVFNPSDGETQRIKAIVTHIEEDAKSLWIKIDIRKSYMILAQGLSGNDRSDKNKELRISLDYVSPSGSADRGNKFRQQWKAYTIKVLKKELLNQPVFADIRYAERSRKFWGTIYKIVHLNKGDRLRDINLWMVNQGLSFYFINNGKSPKDKEYLAVQKISRKNRRGLWSY